MTVEEQTRVQKFYHELAKEMKAIHIHFVWSNEEQKNFGVDKTIFIPFDQVDTEDKNGFGLYLFLHEIETVHGSEPCLVAAATLKLVDDQHVKDIALLLHEINLNSSVQGWILDIKDKLLYFKFLFPTVNIAEKSIGAYLTVIAEILRTISTSFPLIKEIVDGKSFKDIISQVAQNFQ